MSFLAHYSREAALSFTKRPSRKRRGQKDAYRRRPTPLELLEARTLLSGTPADAAWVEQGPEPILNAQLNIPAANNPATGAIESIAVNPHQNADGTWQMYVGTVNGGVWRTDNAGTSNPSATTWQPLTDQAASLAIGSIAFSPLDTTGNTLFAGTGSLSSKADEGGPNVGILRTTDGGATWSNFAVNPGNEPRIKAVLPTSINLASGGTLQEMVLVAAIDSSGGAGNGGLYRSDDNGQNFTVESGSNGLPLGQVTRLIADPMDSDRFFAGVTGSSAGIYRGDFDPATGIITWTNVGGNIPAADLASASDIQLAAGTFGGQTAVYAGINDNGGFAGVFQSTDGGANWTPLGKPSGFGASPFYQASFSMVVDPTNFQTVYLGGDGINLFRYDPTVPGWVSLTGAAASNTYPHPDSRDLAFLGSSVLIESDDGGIYYLPYARGGSSTQWGSFIGQGYPAQGALGVTEVSDAAWDSHARVAIEASQDNGVGFQNGSGIGTWNMRAGGDGGGVAVDNLTLAAGNESIRYYTSQGNTTPPLQYLMRQTYAANNSPVGAAVSIPPSGLNGFNGLFNSPLAIDSVAPTAAQLAAGQSTRMIIGGYQSTSPIYESDNAGAADPANIAWTAVPVSTSGTYTVDALAAGGTQAGVGNADVLYAGLNDGTSALVYVRSTAGGALIPTATPFPGGFGSEVMGIALDPTDWMHAVAINPNGVWETADAGATWTNETGDLNNDNLRSVQYLHLATGDVVLVGGQGGVFAMFANKPGIWTKFGDNLPNAVTYSIDYDPTNDILVAGTLGRGVWTFSNASASLAAPAVVAGAAGAFAATEGIAMTTTLATFTDPNGAGPLSSYSAIVDWGDGSAAASGTISGPDTGGIFTVTGSHTYADESAAPQMIAVAIARIGSPNADVQDSATVADAPLTAGTASASGVEGNTSLVATFTDADPGDHSDEMVASIDWGDHTTSTVYNVYRNNYSLVPITYGSGSGVHSLSASHAYAEEGVYPVSIVVTDKGGAAATIAGQAIVADASLSAYGRQIDAQANVPFSGAAATFTDAGGAEALGDYAATIDWGDGGASSPGTVSGPDANGVFTVSGSHTYPSAGERAVVVTVHHDTSPDTIAKDLAFVSDGTATPTATMLADVYASNAAELNGALYFLAASLTSSGLDLWKTDGTPSGTTLVAAGVGNGSSSDLDRADLFSVNGHLAFFSGDGTQLWTDDGTTAGAVQLATLNNAQVLMRIGGILYFSAADTQNSSLLARWETDGTAAGTVELAVVGGKGNYQTEAVTLNGKQYFEVGRYNVGRYGYPSTIWTSNGTAAGTYALQVKQSDGTLSQLQAYGLSVANNSLVIDVSPGTDEYGDPLPPDLEYVSEPSATGIVELTDDNTPTTFADTLPQSVELNGMSYFAGNQGDWHAGLWVSDGTPAGTFPIADVDADPTSLTVINGQLFFSGSDGIHGYEPWISDGTAAGTRMIADINPGSADSDPSNFAAFGNEVYFTADDSTDRSRPYILSGSLDYSWGAPSTPSISLTAISLTAGPAIELNGSDSLSATATVGGGEQPTGTVTFYLFAPGETLPIYHDVSQLQNGVATASFQLGTTSIQGHTFGVPFEVGDYQWIADYNGDANDSHATGGPAPEAVVPSDVDVTIIPDQTAVATGQQVGFTIQVHNEGSFTATNVSLTDGLPEFPSPGIVKLGDYPITWQIDTSGAGLGTSMEPADFQLTNSSPQSLSLVPSVSLVAGATISVHVIGQPSVPGTSEGIGTLQDSAGVSSPNQPDVDVHSAQTYLSGPTSIVESTGGRVTLGSGGRLSTEAIVAGYDNPTGTVTFYLFNPTTPANLSGIGAVYTEVAPLNGGVAVTGTGSSTGSAIPTEAGLYQWVAIYSGDANNKSVSTALQSEGVAPPPLVYNSSGGVVAVGAIDGTTLQIIAGGYVNSNGVVIGGQVVASAPLEYGTSVIVNGEDGVANDFVLDYERGPFYGPITITFNGGNLANTPSNLLTLDYGGFDTDVYHFTGAHDGYIGIGGALVNFTNLTPLVNTGTTNHIVLTLPDGTVDATLDAGPSAGTIDLVSGNGTFETTTLAAPSGSLTVNSGNGTDTVHVTDAFYQNFGGEVTVAGAANTLPLYAVAAGALATTEGASLTAVLATFRDPNGAGQLSDYSATVDWGDGSGTTTASITGPDTNGVFTISGIHTYTESAGAPETLTVVVHRPNAVDATVTDSVTIAGLPLTGSNTAIAGGTEGAALSSVLADATFTDSNPGDHSADMTATITWGDNGPTSQGTIAYNNGVYTVSGSHTYRDDGTWPISIVVSDGGQSTTAIRGTADVADAPLAAGTATATVGTEGVAASTLTATFSDANQSAPTSDFSGTINWGDGTVTPFALSAVSGGGGSYTIGGSHQYAEEGTYTVTVNVSDDGGSATSLNTTAQVNDAPLSAGTAAATAGTEGVLASTLTAAFTDANQSAPTSDFSGTINWGDGTVTPFTSSNVSGSGGSFTIGGSHQYADEGMYTVSVGISDIGGSAASVSTTAQVSDAPLTGSNAATAGGTEGAALSSVLGGATFTDGNPGDHSADMTATITWGDPGPTSLGTVSYSSGVYTVSGSHTYTEEGTWPISILVNDDGNSVATITGNAGVADAPLTVGQSLTIQAVAGHTLTGVTIATFSDQGGPEGIGDYSASIDWGDHSPTGQGTILPHADGSFSVQASHTYAVSGTYTVNIAVSHENGIVANSSATVVVSSSLLVLNPRSEDSLDVSGGAQLQLGDADTAAVDSSNRQAIEASGRATIAAAEIDVAGKPGYDINGKAKINATIVSGATPVGDPLAGLVVPEQPIASTHPVRVNGRAPVTLQAGTYIGGISIGGNAQVTLASGVYYIEGGGFNVSGHASVSGQGVLIYDAASGRDIDGISISGTANVNLTALDSGPYQGIALWQAAANQEWLLLGGGARLDVTGAIDAAGAAMFVSGMAQANIQSDAAHSLVAQLIVDRLYVTGQAALTIDAATQPATNRGGALRDAAISAPQATSGAAAGDSPGDSLTPNKLYVQAVYRDLLGRPVEAAALQFWSAQLDGGLSRTAFVSDIDQSGEYLTKLVEHFYQTDLGRAADTLGLAFWVAQLEAGMTDAELQAALISSPEYYADAGGTDAAWIASLYEALFSRPADAQGEAFWTSKLSAGMARSEVALGFAASSEQAHARLADQYAQYLGRPIDPSAITGGGNALAGGTTNEQFLAYLLASDEYFNLYAGE